MTSTSPTPPDLSGLSISPQHVRSAHDSYDYDNLAVGSNPRQQYFATSPAVHSQVPYNPLGLNQSPLKNKSISRSGLPTVCHPSSTIFSSICNSSGIQSTHSNGSIINSLTTPAQCRLPPTQTSRREAHRLRCHSYRFLYSLRPSRLVALPAVVSMAMRK